MADTKISALTSATTPLAGTEVLPIVQGSTTVKVATNDLTVRNVRAAATTGILQVSGPSAAATRTMTVPDANFTAARTDAGQTFTGNQVITASGTSILTVQTTGTTGQEVDVKVVATNSDGSSNQWKFATNVGADNEFILYDLTNSQVVDRYIRGASGYRNFWTNGTERMRIASNGIVTMSAYGAGAATFSASGVISSVSDETWKIKDGVPSNPTEMLNKLEPGYWYYNNEKQQIFGVDRQLGFYAQNVNAAIGPEAAPEPELFTVTNDEGVETTQQKPWGYYDRSVLAVVVMSLKEALATIKTLEDRIQVLEQKT